MPLKIWNGSSWGEAGFLKVWNGSSWVSATNGYTWNGSAWTRFFPSVQLTNNSAYNFSRSGLGGSASATARFRNDGVLLLTNNLNLVAVSNEWLIASGTTSDYEVRGTWAGVGGTVFGPTGWVGLGTTRDYSLETFNAVAVRFLTAEIRIAASGLVIATAEIDFEVDSAP